MTGIRSEVYPAGINRLWTGYSTTQMSDTDPTSPPHDPKLTGRAVMHDWWPLAISWGLMGLEMPAISIVIGHLPQAEIMLAAFGGIAFPLGLIVESPIIMMLAASTALSRNYDQFLKLQHFMTIVSIGLTILHAALAFTPLWTWAVIPLLDIPTEVQEPSRLAFAWLLPWTWAIADRRFRQGMLIHFGRREVIAYGTGIRLLATVGMLILLAQLGVMGAVVATASLSTGVIVEAAYVRIRSRPVVAGPLKSAPASDQPLRLTKLLRFYVPLALTPMLVLAAQPIGAAGMTRMPDALASLAVWAPLGGIIFLVRSVGIAYNEVVIRLTSKEGSGPVLRRFAWIAGLIFSGVMLVISLTPLAGIWFQQIVGLKPELAQLGVSVLWLGAPIPLMTFLQSFYQGVLVDHHRTRPVTESVVIYLGITILGLGSGILHGGWVGLIVAITTYTIANSGQTLWLYIRARDLLRTP